MRRSALAVASLVVAVVLLPSKAGAQATVPETELKALLRQICNEQIEMLQRHDTRLRYRVRRSDRKGSTEREVIESHDGGVARLLQHNGLALTQAEEEGDRKRLEALLGSGKVQQRERDEAKNRSYGVDLLRAMPDAMRFTVAPQQAPVPDVPDKQEVVDFSPDPGFHPGSMAQQILTQLHGRLWIDLTDRHLLRMELQNAGEVNLAWGLLAKVYPGGSATYDQRRFQDLYVMTHVALHMRVRELMVKTNALDTDTVVSDVRRLPESPGADAAIRMLLAEPVATR